MASALFEGRRYSTRRTSLARAFPSVVFTRMVNNVLRRYVRRTDHVAESYPPLPDSDFSHLTEMIVRTAQRENWNLHDEMNVAKRIQQVIFHPGSELQKVARYSSLQLIEEETSDDQLLIISNILFHTIPSGSPAASDFAGLLLEDLDLYQDTSSGKHHLINKITT